jgi:tetratricopeptide (TPR) repeat protein
MGQTIQQYLILSAIFIRKGKVFMLIRFILIITSIIFWYLSSSISLAAKTSKPELMDKFPPSPLEITTPQDPLLRPSLDKQPLTTEELQGLAVALDQLNESAAATLLAGDKETAFEIWFRELRLRRLLGSLAEIQALSRVGAISWNENARPETQYITQRLQVIQKQILKETSRNLLLWRSLGEAYQKIRTPKLALEVYQQILTLVREEKDATAEVETLNTLGQLHLSWFNYDEAALTYQELLNLATAANDRLQEVTYLQQLVYIYTQAKLPASANDVLNKLSKVKQDSQELSQIPELKLAIATNYETLAQKNPDLLSEAFKNYQEAYVTAWEQQQYVTASAALQKLIALYRTQKQIDAALQTSQILLESEKLSNNLYGLMQAYNQIGELYQEDKNYPQAIASWENGREIAKKLDYDEGHFTQQIEKLRAGGLKI